MGEIRGCCRYPPTAELWLPTGTVHSRQTRGEQSFFVDPTRHNPPARTRMPMVASSTMNALMSKRGRPRIFKPEQPVSNRNEKPDHRGCSKPSTEDCGPKRAELQ